MTYKGYTIRPCVLARGVSRISCWEIVRADGSRFEIADTIETARHVVDVKADGRAAGAKEGADDAAGTIATVSPQPRD